MKILKFILTIFCGISLFSCEKYFDINTSPNVAGSVSNLNLILSDMIHTTSYNLIGGGNFSRYTNRWMQFTTDATATGGRPDDYVFTTADFNNEWQFASYTSVLVNGKKVVDDGTRLGQWRQVAIAKILMAHNYAILTDFFGDIPFSQALQKIANLKPAYDTQEQVYAGIQQLLDEAIADIDRPVTGNYGTGDFIFGANGGTVAAAGANQMPRWKRLAYILKARYHLRLSNAPGKSPVTQADLAIAALANGFQSAADNARFAYLGGPGQEAPWQQWVAKFSTSHVISRTIVDALKARNDPRLPIYAAPAVNFAIQPYPNNIVGQASGFPPPNNLGAVSALGAYFLATTESVYLATYEEALFLRAEAEFLKGGVATATPFYNQAITAHMNKISNPTNTITAAQITAYLAANPLTNLSDLMTQRWISCYIHAPQEAYHNWRKTGFPNLVSVPSAASNNPNIPTRIPYPDTEILNNAVNVPQGITQNAKVWWDVN